MLGWFFILSREIGDILWVHDLNFSSHDFSLWTIMGSTSSPASPPSACASEAHPREDIHAPSASRLEHTHHGRVFVGAIGSSAVVAELANNRRVDIKALIAEPAGRELLTLFGGVMVLTVVAFAQWPVSASDFGWVAFPRVVIIFLAGIFILIFIFNSLFWSLLGLISFCLIFLTGIFGLFYFFELFLAELVEERNPDA